MAIMWRGLQKLKGGLAFCDKKGGQETILTTSPQWFTEESETKVHPLGTKLVVEDMRFTYSHINASSDSCWRGRGLANLGKNLGGGNSYLDASAMTAAVEHATDVTITVSGITANEFENGIIAIFPSVWTGIITGRVKSNDATSASSTKFYLKEGVQAACGASSTAKIHWNQYAYTGKASTGDSVRFRCSQVGCLCENATVDYYVWLQTWGPYLGQYSTWKMGQGNYLRAVYFDTYGGMMPYSATASNGNYKNAQYAGFCLGPSWNATDAADSWTPLVMLQISP